jgi:hypothetical protein
MHVCAQVWTVGDNRYGRLGYADRLFGVDPEDVLLPVRLPSPTSVVQISAGDWHMVLLDEDGRVCLQRCANSGVMITLISWAGLLHLLCLLLRRLGAREIITAGYRVIGNGLCLKWFQNRAFLCGWYRCRPE